MYFGIFKDPLLLTLKINPHMFDDPSQTQISNAAISISLLEMISDAF